MEHNHVSMIIAHFSSLLHKYMSMHRTVIVLLELRRVAFSTTWSTLGPCRLFLLVQVWHYVVTSSNFSLHKPSRCAGSLSSTEAF